jgi:hypothetical protein
VGKFLQGRAKDIHSSLNLLKAPFLLTNIKSLSETLIAQWLILWENSLLKIEETGPVKNAQFCPRQVEDPALLRGKARILTIPIIHRDRHPYP